MTIPGALAGAKLLLTERIALAGPNLLLTKRLYDRRPRFLIGKSKESTVEVEGGSEKPCKCGPFVVSALGRRGREPHAQPPRGPLAK